jgi:hypothetical protein
VHFVVLTLAQDECGKDIAASLQCTVYRCEGHTCTSCNASGTDVRLSFNEFEDLLFHLYITYRT